MLQFSEQKKLSVYIILKTLYLKIHIMFSSIFQGRQPSRRTGLAL